MVFDQSPVFGTFSGRGPLSLSTLSEYAISRSLRDLAQALPISEEELQRSLILLESSQRRERGEGVQALSREVRNAAVYQRIAQCLDPKRRGGSSFAVDYTERISLYDALTPALAVPAVQAIFRHALVAPDANWEVRDFVVSQLGRWLRGQLEPVAPSAFETARFLAQYRDSNWEVNLRLSTIDLRRVLASSRLDLSLIDQHPLAPFLREHFEDLLVAAYHRFGPHDLPDYADRMLQGRSVSEAVHRRVSSGIRSEVGHLRGEYCSPCGESLLRYIRTHALDSYRNDLQGLYDAGIPSSVRWSSTVQEFLYEAETRAQDLRKKEVESALQLVSNGLLLALRSSADPVMVMSDALTVYDQAYHARVLTPYTLGRLARGIEYLWQNYPEQFLQVLVELGRNGEARRAFVQGALDIWAPASGSAWIIWTQEVLSRPDLRHEMLEGDLSRRAQRRKDRVVRKRLVETLNLLSASAVTRVPVERDPTPTIHALVLIMETASEQGLLRPIHFERIAACVEAIEGRDDSRLQDSFSFLSRREHQRGREIVRTALELAGRRELCRYLGWEESS